MNDQDSLEPSNASRLAEEVLTLPAKWKRVISNGLRKITALQAEEKQAKLGDALIEPMLVATENHRQKDLNLSVFDNTPDFLQYLLDLEAQVEDDSVIHQRAMVGAQNGYHYGAFDIRVEKKKNEKPQITVIGICSIDGFEIKTDFNKYLKDFPIDVGVKIVATNVMASPTGCRIFAKSFASKMLKHPKIILELHRRLKGEIGKRFFPLVVIQKVT